MLVVSSPRVFGQDGSGAAPHTQPVLQITNSGFTPLSPVLKELQRNEGAWQAQACALGMDSSILTPVKNVPGLKRAGCINLELKPQSKIQAWDCLQFNTNIWHGDEEDFL